MKSLQIKLNTSKINSSVFKAFPVLKTNRLTLRQILPKDAEAIFKMRTNQHISAFIARNPMTEEKDAKSLVEKVNLAFEKHEGIAWAGILRDKGGIIGTCGFNRFDYQNNRAEIGGELSAEYWGKHIAAEAVSSIVQFGLESLNLHAIEAKVSPLNRGAIHLLEALGFQKEAHFKDFICFNDVYADMAVYTLIRGQQTFLHSV